MGLVYANIELVNADDMALNRRGYLGEDEIRQIEVNCLVDSCSIMLCINEEIRAALGLAIVGERPSRMADGTRIKLPIATGVWVKFQDRTCLTNALVLPEDEDVLLGAIPMEEMDLYIHPGRNELAPVHPEGPVMILK